MERRERRKEEKMYRTRGVGEEWIRNEKKRIEMRGDRRGDEE